MDGSHFPPTARTRVRRQPARARYDRETLYAIFDAGLVCHVGYVIDGHPYVTATSYWREGERIYWHGSSASRMLRTLKGGVPVCLNVSLIDGLVLARSGFHHSVNYRTAMLFGIAEPVVDGEEKLASLRAFTERLFPGRWDELRPVKPQELKATMVLRMDIDEAAAKVRAGPPLDEEEDYGLDLDVWTGVLPLQLCAGTPQPDPRLKPGTPEPGYLKGFALARPKDAKFA